MPAETPLRGCIRALVVLCAAGLPAALSLAPSHAAAPAPATRAAAQDPSVGLQFQEAQAKVFRLNNQIKDTQARLDEGNRVLDADRTRQAAMETELGKLARLEYERPALTLSSVMAAPTLDRLLDAIAVTRVVAGRQQALVESMSQLRDRDQKTRDDVVHEMDQLKLARAQAASATATALGLRSAVVETLLSQAKPGDPFAGGCQPVMEQPFGPTDLYFEPSFLGFLHFHTGVDLSCPEGTAIHTVTNGIAHVTYGWGGGFGNNVVVETQGTSPDGTPATYFVRYAHMLSDIPVQDGATVHTGDVIGHLGSTGASTGPHLHFEVDVGMNDISHAVDPSILLTVV